MLTTSSATYWFQFFLDSGIPADDAGRYAGSFSKHRIAANMAIDLNREYLEQLGITALGDCIAILKHAKELYAKELKEKQIKNPLNNKVNVNDDNSLKYKSSEMLAEASTCTLKKIDTTESISIEADSVSDGATKSIDASKSGLIMSNNTEKPFKPNEFLKSKFEHNSKDHVASHKEISRTKGSSPKMILNFKDKIKSKEVLKYDNEELESSNDEEMCYVEHKTVSIKPSKHVNRDKEKHIKKTSIKRTSEVIESKKNHEHKTDKKSVFERLGHEAIEERRIETNNFDSPSVFNRLGNKVKKRKVSLIINKNVYEASDSSDNNDNVIEKYDDDEMLCEEDKNIPLNNLKNFSETPLKTISAGVLSSNSIQPDKFIKSSEGIFSPHASSQKLNINKRLGRRIPEKIVMETKEEDAEAKVKAESKKLARFVKAELVRSNYQEKSLENQAKKLKTERLIACNVIGPDRLSRGKGTMQMDKMRVEVFDRLGR